VLSNLPVVRSTPARVLFLASAAAIAGTLLWAQYYVGSHGARYLAPIFYTLFITFDCQAAAGLLLILIVAALLPDRFRIRAPLCWIGTHPGTIAAGTAIVLCAGTLLVYQNHPLAMDEYAQVFQSQVFATGHITGQFPPALIDWLVPSPFQNMFFTVSHSTGMVASAYWPAFALLLTPFTFVGAPWACNAVISALTLVVVHRLALRIFGDVETAGLAVLLTAASPVFLANGISYYPMPAHLLANAVFALLLLEPTKPRALLAGLVGSIALTLHNPVPHILFAVPWLIAVVRRPGGLRLVGFLTAGYAPLCLLLGFGWFWFTGEVRHSDIPAAAADALTSGSGLTGIGKTLAIFSLPSWGVVLARLVGFAKVALWAVPCLLVLAAAGAWKWRHHTPCRLLVASAALTLVGYFLVPFDQGHGWGYRYFHSAWIALPLLAAGAFTRAPAVARAGAFEADDALTFAVTCAFLTLVFGVGLRAVQMHEFIADNLRQVPAYTGTERQVVIIDPGSSFYGWDLIRNDPWLRGNVIRMIAHGAAADTDMMRTHFPGLHRVYHDQYGSVWSQASQHQHATLLEHPQF
jgi:hypothetical protein